jgi:nitrogen fixation/metabolism regulation signal transduction histidine kinase
MTLAGNRAEIEAALTMLLFHAERSVHDDPKAQQSGIELEVTSPQHSCVYLTVRNIGEPFEWSADELETHVGGMSAWWGLGYGLYAVSRIAKRHGGSLDLRSRPDLNAATLKLPGHYLVPASRRLEITER